ncbi:putative deoxyribonuclease TATDN2 isoform X2 [Paramacrobiotus metropolitanus]|uniref:putative deoxyribonuclease TATDN2 isoform X2 n=1 Tax=Paramacrobiotus metropolitanus TaxID=2943436 RepID=UPI002445F1F7|nr:putative deoxyribonuclease TATDN2 isoform X2 [Paramacrobiotus metropolitanus]
MNFHRPQYLLFWVFLPYAQRQSPPDGCCETPTRPDSNPRPRERIRFDMDAPTDHSASAGGTIGLGPYHALFQDPLPGNAKFIDAHTHLCFFLSKLGDRTVQTYGDIRLAFPQAYPPSYGGAIQVFCAPQYLTSFDTWRKRLVEGTEGELWFTAGCHPHFVGEWNDSLKAALERVMTDLRAGNRLVALGECGLDFDNRNRGDDKKVIQRRVFKEQLDMARRWDLPVVIHCRQDGADSACQAEKECFDILKERLPHNWPVHRHCFRSDYFAAIRYMDYFPNVVLGFVPLDYSKDTKLSNVIQSVPLDRVVLETDAPYFLPAQMTNFPRAPNQNQLSVPGGLALATAKIIAELKNLPVEMVAERTYENTKRIYKLP